MSRKKKTDLEKIREQLDQEIVELMNALVYRIVQKASLGDETFENKARIYICEYLIILDLITKLFRANFQANMDINVPDVVKEWARKIVEGKNLEEFASEVKEMFEKGIIKRKTTRKTPGEPEYISFTTDDKWKRF
jgi:hypothetical protein